MYKPVWTNVSEQELVLSVLANHGFATLIGCNQQASEVAHLPLQVARSESSRPDGLALEGHAAAMNPILEYFDGRSNITAVFHGPHHYVSPAWYRTEGVPTWNYVVVHCSGRGTLMSYEDAKESFHGAVAHYEAKYGAGWSAARMSEGALSKRLGHIRHFRLEVTSVEAKFKLSQNKSVEDRYSTIERLEEIGSDDSREVARYMKLLMDRKA